MKLKPLTNTKALNKAYLKQSINRDDLERFRKALLRLKDRINETEGEEYHKNIVTDFLREGIYLTNYEINVKDRKDLVIYNGKTVKDLVGVILEVKRPTNTIEMISLEHPNTKAMQELLLYYLQERIDKNNLELKHLIATNIYEWYIFDEKYFEMHFFRSSKLKREYDSYKRSGKDTKFFYENIAKKHINEISEEIPVVHINLQKFFERKAITDEILVPPFKILSPEHLLKLPFANDSNTLNKEFYNELLHILGLEEAKEGSKKLIRRKETKERNDGSLLENTINIMEADDALSTLENTEHFGETKEAQLFSIGLELCITWLNRILFLKLLEGQLIKYHRGKRTYAFLSSKIVTDFDDLKELFFEVLAVKEDERKTSVNKKFGKIPYLNSSLFELTELERQTVKINALKHRLELPLYSTTVLKDKHNPNRRLSGPKSTLEYLFEFLDAYDFSSEDAIAVQEQSKTIINASVLGLIFEKINGYKDGSFFTPGFITMYMCREAIRKAVVQKFNDYYKWECKSIEELQSLIEYDKKEKRQEANNIINSLKICDPAVGSGHFLVSALNEIIAIKSEMNILCYRDGNRIRTYRISIENDEPIILDEETDRLFEYVLNEQQKPLTEAQRLQEALFHEKQIIIENCLFGVDINPKSAMICRLRLWIELLKHAYYRPEHNYRYLETLPNIDINIKVGNSLISRFDIQDDYQKLPSATKQKIKLATQKYKDQVTMYKSTNNKTVKQQAEKEIVRLKEEFSNITNPLDKDYKLLKQKERELWKRQQDLPFPEEREKWGIEINKLATELTELKQRYEQTQKILYNNAFEWRFEFPEILNDDGNFVGFDVVIGNPPYGLINKKQNQKIGLSITKESFELIKERFPESEGGVLNISKVFYSLSFRILREKGIAAMIIPFGFLTDITSAGLRKFIFQNYSLVKVDAFPERDNANKRIFEEAKMSTSIIVSTKEKTNKPFDIGVSYERSINHDNRLNLTFEEIKKFDESLLLIPLTSKLEFEILIQIYSRKNTVRIKNISPCLTGEVDITLAKTAITNDPGDIPLIKGVQIDRYILKQSVDSISQGEIQFLNEDVFCKIYAGDKLQHANQQRIVLQALTGINENYRLKCQLISPKKYLGNSANYILPNNRIDIKCLLGILNSSLINFIFKCRSTNSNVNGYEVDELPLVIPQNQSIGNLVNKIIIEKERDPEIDTAQLEDQIDQLVYKLYGLTKEEIRIVEGKE